MTKIKINCNRKQLRVVFYSSFVCMSAYANFFFTAICKCICQLKIYRSWVHCGSAVRFGRALPGYPITAQHLYASLKKKIAFIIARKEVM